MLEMASQELTVVYGSQTGQAEAIAKELHRTAVEEHNLKHAVCYCTNDIERKARNFLFYCIIRFL